MAKFDDLPAELVFLLCELARDEDLLVLASVNRILNAIAISQYYHRIDFDPVNHNALMLKDGSYQTTKSFRLDLNRPAFSDILSYGTLTQADDLRHLCRLVECLRVPYNMSLNINLDVCSEASFRNFMDTLGKSPCLYLKLCRRTSIGRWIGNPHILQDCAPLTSLVSFEAYHSSPFCPPLRNWIFDSLNNSTSLTNFLLGCYTGTMTGVLSQLSLPSLQRLIIVSPAQIGSNELCEFLIRHPSLTLVSLRMHVGLMTPPSIPWPDGALPIIKSLLASPLHLDGILSSSMIRKSLHSVSIYLSFPVSSTVLRQTMFAVILRRVLEIKVPEIQFHGALGTVYEDWFDVAVSTPLTGVRVLNVVFPIIKCQDLEEYLKRLPLWLSRNPDIEDFSATSLFERLGMHRVLNFITELQRVAPHVKTVCLEQQRKTLAEWMQCLL